VAVYLKNLSIPIGAATGNEYQLSNNFQVFKGTLSQKQF
jgi:hypothetical protein